MDAFGNLLVDHLSAAEPLATQHLNCATDPNAHQDGLWPDKKQVIAGAAQYHGSEGYEADVIDGRRVQTPPAAGRSTGFIHVGVRYYEPATGRFLEYDPARLCIGMMMYGQANRWTYCAND